MCLLLARAVVVEDLSPSPALRHDIAAVLT
jgi:hypothetical protein